jgi:hypothetical protein
LFFSLGLEAFAGCVKKRQNTSRSANFRQKRQGNSAGDSCLCLIEQQHNFFVFVQAVLGCFLFLGFDALAGCV